MKLAPKGDPFRPYSSSGSVLCVTSKRVVHSTCMGTRDLGFSLTNNWCVDLGSTSRGPSLLFGFPMSDLSTLSSGKLVHPDV